LGAGRGRLWLVRELLLGPKRFTDLRTGLPHVSPDVLAQRLRELEQDGVVRRRTLAPPAGSKVYELTDRGRELKPVILGLGRWGSSEAFPPGDARLGPDSAVIALLTVFDPAAADGLAATYELRLDDQVFRARVADGRVDFARGAAEDPDATIETDPGTLARVLSHRRKRAEAEGAGDLEIDGSRRAVTRFLRLFQVPKSA